MQVARSSVVLARLAPHRLTSNLKHVPIRSLATDESFARGLFEGKFVEAPIYPYPQVLSDDQREELGMFIDPLTKFFEERVDPAQNDIDAAVPAEVSEEMKGLGLFGLQVPPELGGVGLSNSGYARMGEIMGAFDLGIGIYLGAHQSIGFKGITLFGTDEQKEKYLPALASGENIAAFSLTEPSSGSDANSVRTRAVLKSDEQGDYFELNGAKLWTSNGGIAEIFTVFAQTEVENPKTGEKGDKVTAFIVERSFGGVTHGPPENKMGIKCSNTAEVFFDAVRVPAENVLGEVGGGFKVAMAILNNGRFGMGGALSGTMKACLAGAAAHAGDRVQFGKPLLEFGGIQAKLARMAALTYATESVAYLVSSAMDAGSEDYQIEAAISKVFASDNAWYVADETIQMLGGLGFMRDYPYERTQRDLRIFRIFEGTNDILKLFVALTGMQSAGAGLKDLQKALKSPLSNFGKIASAASTRVLRQVGQGGDTLSAAAVTPALSAEKQQLEALTAQFAQVVESLLVAHGKGIIDQQQQLTRVADCVIDLYAMAAATSRATAAVNDSLPTAGHELQLAQLFCGDASVRVRGNLSSLRGDGYAAGDSLVEGIARDIVANQGFFAVHPLRV